jgi:hypothetical protein
MIPDWTPEGLLPVGIHVATPTEVEERFVWNAHRASLLLGLGEALKSLKGAGCTRLWLDGSFVTTKELPSDWDACWSTTGVLEVLVEPIFKLEQPTDRQAIKSKYLGDLIPAGIELGSGLPFVEFFQQSRDGAPKGIVLLNPQEIQ